MLGLRNGRGTYLVQRAALDLVGDLATKTGSFTYRHCRCGSAVRRCLSFANGALDRSASSEDIQVYLNYPAQNIYSRARRYTRIARF